MTEIKPEVKQPKSYQDRIKDMSWPDLQREADRISRNPESKLGGAIAALHSAAGGGK